MRSNKEGKRKPGLSSCDSDKIPVYTMRRPHKPGSCQDWQGVPNLRGARAGARGGSFLLSLAPCTPEETGCAPALVALSKMASLQASNSETADGLSVNFTQGRHHWGRKAQLPPPDPSCRAGSGPERCGPEITRFRLLNWGPGGGSKSILVPPTLGPVLGPLSPLFSLSNPRPPWGSPPSKSSLFLLRTLQKVSLKSDSK